MFFSDRGRYFQIDGRMKLGMSINGAFKTALSTWKSWVESKINSSRTDVFFRTFESTHWRCVLLYLSGISLFLFSSNSILVHTQKLTWFNSCICSIPSSGSRQSCKVTREPEPMSRVKGLDHSPISDAIVKVVKNTSIPVTLLHVTPLGAFRSDAHVGTWSDNPSVPDCSHWCLPGVPDTWNELLFSFLLNK